MCLPDVDWIDARSARRIRQTSIDVYREMQDNGLLSARRWEVYDILYHHGPMTSNEVFQHARLHGNPNYRHNTNARMTELRDLGVAQELGTTICNVTGHRVILWDVTDKLPRKPNERETRPTRKQLVEKIKTLIDENAALWRQLYERRTPMRHFVTGCGIAVPVSEQTNSLGFTHEYTTREACKELTDGGLPRLLTAQTHEQAKATCLACPRCGTVAPHLAVMVGNDRMRTLADEPPPSGSYTPPQPDPVRAATPPAAPAPSNGAGDMPAWMREMMQAAGTTPAPQAAVVGIGAGGAVVSPEPEQPAPEPPPPGPPEDVPFALKATPDGGAVAHCSQCGQPFSAPACGPTHAAVAAAAAGAVLAGIAPPPEPAQAPPQPDAGAMFDAAMTHPKATPKIDTLIRAAGVDTGPSVMGSSTLRAFQICMRAGFYRIVRGIRRRRQTERQDDRGYWKFDPLALGTLVHQVLARFYEGAENPYDFLKDITPHYPNIVEETRRLCTLHFNAYAERDRQQLDVRFVELESRYYFKKKRVKSAKKNLSLCVSSKHDLGFRKMRPDEPRLPPGVEASAIAIMDHKTIGSMTSDAQQAYRHDPQIFTNAVTYNRGNSVVDGVVGEPSAAIFGPLTHFTINLIGKAIQHDPTKHLVRLTQIIPHDLLDSYADDIHAWLYGELAERLFHPAAQDDETWPKSYLCRDPSTGRPCPYVELCERGGLKRVDPSINYAIERPYDPELLLRPEVKKKGRRRKAKAAAEVESK